VFRLLLDAAPQAPAAVVRIPESAVVVLTPPVAPPAPPAAPTTPVRPS
jgi:hypothetical protein